MPSWSLTYRSKARRETRTSRPGRTTLICPVRISRYKVEREIPRAVAAASGVNRSGSPGASTARAGISGTPGQAACRPPHDVRFGVPGRTRTDDLPLRRRPLYPLSYGDTATRRDRGMQERGGPITGARWSLGAGRCQSARAGPAVNRRFRELPRTPRLAYPVPTSGARASTRSIGVAPDAGC